MRRNFTFFHGNTTFTVTSTQTSVILHCVLPGNCKVKVTNQCRFLSWKKIQGQKWKEAETKVSYCCFLCSNYYFELTSQTHVCLVGFQPRSLPQFWTQMEFLSLSLGKWYNLYPFWELFVQFGAVQPGITRKTINLVLRPQILFKWRLNFLTYHGRHT